MVGEDGVFDNFGNSGFTSDLGDGVDGGCADNLGDNVASLDGGDDLLDNWDINAMFGGDLSAGSLDGLGNWCSPCPCSKKNQKSEIRNQKYHNE